MLSIVSPILTADIISAITVFDFERAKTNLLYDFLIIIISAVSYFSYYLVSTKTNRFLITNLQKYVYSSVEKNKNINKISLSVLNDIYSCVNFNKNLLYKFCFLIKAIIILIIIVYYNLYIALAIIAVSFVSFFLLRFTDKKIQRHNLAFSSYQNESLELFNSIQQGADAEQSTTASALLKDKYFAYVNSSIKTNNRISLLYNINNNFITLILKTTIFLATLYLITLVKSTTLTLSLYLILTPYLTSSAQNLISFFDLFSEFGTVENALMNFEALKFQSQISEEERFELSTYNLYFFHTSTSKNDESYTPVADINLQINHKDFAIICGETDSGKETIFNLLKKKVKPSSGSIFIDNKNIADISPESYQKLISFTSVNPYFYNISIFENMYLVCQNKTKIQKTFSEWDLSKEVAKYKDKINSVVSTIKNSSLLFFLGLARSYLSGAKIICIYELPNTFLSHEKELLKTIIKKIKKECSILLFSNDSLLTELADNVYETKNGKIKIKQIQNKNV